MSENGGVEAKHGGQEILWHYGPWHMTIPGEHIIAPKLFCAGGIYASFTYLVVY